MSGLRNRLLRRFRDRDYRHSYVESFLNSLISAQIRALREREGFSQDALARAIGTTQSGISRLESPDYSSWKIDTLSRLARAFDLSLSVKFVSFGDMVEDVAGFGETRLLRPSFEQDPVFHGGAAATDDPPPTSIRLDPKAERALEELARQRSQTKSELVRRAIDELLTREQARERVAPFDRAADLIGSVSDGPEDLSESPRSTSARTAPRRSGPSS
jgi:transcriptional regulator with XRE-family HTH domain